MVMKAKKQVLLGRTDVVGVTTATELYISTLHNFNPLFLLSFKNVSPHFADLHLKITIQTHHREERLGNCAFV